MTTDDNDSITIRRRLDNDSITMNIDEDWREVQELEKELAEMEAAFEAESSRHALQGLRMNNVLLENLENSWILVICCDLKQYQTVK